MHSALITALKILENTYLRINVLITQ